MGVVKTPSPLPAAYGIEGRYLFFDEERLDWVTLAEVDSRTWIALDEAATDLVSIEGRYIRIES